MARRLLRRLRCRWTLACLLGAALSSGCIRPAPPPRLDYRVHALKAPEKDYYRELPAGQHALRRVTDPSQWPVLSAGLHDVDALRRAVDHSLAYLAKPSARAFFPVSGVSHDHVARSLEAFRDLLDLGLRGEALAAELRSRFDVYTSVGCDDRGTVLFTGYYTPIFAAARERSPEFSHPLHRAPANLVKDPLTGEIQGLRRPDGSLDPDVPDRASLLASGQLDGLELVWMRDAFEAYVVGVQGSALLRLRDGSRMEVGYAGTNGKPYASIGRALVRAGKLRREELNLRRMIEHFRAHPDDFAALSAENQRYVFFQESRGGPFGCLNTPVTPQVTLATDKTIFPRGALCFVEAALPVDEVDAHGVYRGFALDQDAGGAIRAPGRCDVFMGVGDAAGEVAGRTLAEGRLYYLLLKEDVRTLK